MSDVREEVRKNYAAAARRVTNDPGTAASCCGPAIQTIDANAINGAPSQASCCGPNEEGFGAALYGDSDTGELPDTAVLASLGCGNPVAVADLEPGDVVLDLGSGGGIDVLLSAKRVGPTGKAYGLDMTDEMLALALENKKKADVDNAEFLKGYIEDIPLPADTIDVVISNCVINLAADKQAVFAEMARVLKPGGRIGVSDVVADNELDAPQRAERGSFVGCIAGALSFSEYEEGLRSAGFEDITITSTHEVVPGMHSAIVKATRPIA